MVQKNIKELLISSKYLIILKNRKRLIIFSMLFLVSICAAYFISLKKDKIEFFMTGYDSFGNEKWLVDKKTGIAMSFENNSKKYYDNYSIRFSSLKGGSLNKNTNGYEWVGEYFCEPDNIVIVNNENDYKISYLPYLKWRKDFFINNDGSFGRVSVYREAFYGKIRSYDIERKYLTENDDLDLDIKSDHTIYAGKNIVKSNIYIKNEYDYPINAYYIIQDAAYLNLSDNNSIGVMPISFRAGDMNSASSEYGKFTNKNNERYFIGSYRDNYNLLAGFFVNQDDIVLGLSDKYLGIKNIEIKDDNQMRVDVWDGDIKENLDNIFAPEESHPKINDVSYVNRFIVFPINELKPNEERSITYYRIMIDNNENKKIRSLKEWAAEVETILDKQLPEVE
jgi:hypothetical protein